MKSSLKMAKLSFATENTNDSKAMGDMLQRAKSILGNNEFTSLYDKGYHTGSEFDIANKLGIDVLVAIPTVAANAPNHDYNVEHFTYNKEEDSYTCPKGKKKNEQAETRGLHHKKRAAGPGREKHPTEPSPTCLPSDGSPDLS